MPSPAVPDHIWALIVGYVQRKQEWVTVERKEAIHQHDLTVLMRVNKVRFLSDR
jgi:hypothetical protein